MQGLIDSTLREGMQAVGVDLSLKRRVELAAALVAMGVEEIELGPVRAGDDELARLVAGCRRQAGASRLAIWCRCRAEDIDQALALAPEVLALSMPVSPVLLRTKLQRNQRQVEELVAAALARARGRVSCLALGLEDATRAEPRFLAELVELARRQGVDRIRLADTVGVATPAELVELVGRVRRQAGSRIAIGVHTHNDFGMAAANAIAALEAGADWADVSLLGLGERAGLARLEEVAGFLALRRQRPYRLTGLPQLCAGLAREIGRGVAPHSPVVGSEIFACETGLHLAALAVDPASYEPFAPELVGGKRNLLYGIKVGRRAIDRQWRRWRTCQGVEPERLCADRSRLPEEVAPAGLVARVRQAARELRRPLTCEELQGVFLGQV
ncbi:LeuA family protein [Desulfurivibrio sp. D14AmB]|uniref:LeuA family protein n=1 Tax=Desulfurivibrio sp. D14AmB TaxID=3374370 RepID=UPI00376ECADE